MSAMLCLSPCPQHLQNLDQTRHACTDFRTAVSPIVCCVQEQYVVLEDPALQHTSTGYNIVVQQLELVSLTRTAVMHNQKAAANV